MYVICSIVFKVVIILFFGHFFRWITILFSPVSFSTFEMPSESYKHNRIVWINIYFNWDDFSFACWISRCVCVCVNAIFWHKWREIFSKYFLISWLRIVHASSVSNFFTKISEFMYNFKCDEIEMKNDRERERERSYHDYFVRYYSCINLLILCIFYVHSIYCRWYIVWSFE